MRRRATSPPNCARPVILSKASTFGVLRPMTRNVWGLCAVSMQVHSRLKGMAKAAMLALRVYYSPQRFFHVAVLMGCLLGLSLALILALILAGCVSWTHLTKPSTAFADDAAACE